MFLYESLYSFISFLGHIYEEYPWSLFLQKYIDDEIISNLSADQSAGHIDTDNQARSQVEENVEDDLGWLEEETNQETHLTDQEIKSRKTNLFRRLDQEIKNIHKIFSSDNEDGKSINELSVHFRWISNFVFTIQKIGPLSFDDLKIYQQDAGKQLSNTQSVPLICNVVTKGWQTFSEQLLTNAVELPSTAMQTAMSVLWNFSDCSPQVTFDIMAEKAFLKTLKEILKTYLQERIQGEDMSEEYNKIIGASLSIIQNLSKVDENITQLRQSGFVKYVSPYLDSKTELDRFKALAILSSLVDENESEMLLQGKYELLKMFVVYLEDALQLSTRICLVNNETWSAFELTLIIHQLARNHANKPLLVQMGCLNHLIKLAQIGTIEEKREAVGAIWYLACDKNNQIKILEDKELNLIEKLTDVKEKSEDRTTKEAAEGTLWLLRKHIQNNEKYEDKVRASVKQDRRSDVTDTKKKMGHIMISYNWRYQDDVKKIRDKLKANGYSVWMDIDNISGKKDGSILDAISEAVEKSHVVLICMSQKYKESKICKREAIYADQWDKEIVALKMEKDYKPNGWLGLIVGDDLYYDFSGKYDFDNKCKELLERMAVLYSEDSAETKDSADDIGLVSTKPRSGARQNQQLSLSKVTEWTQKQVNDWLDHHHIPKEVLGNLTGKDLAALIRMKDNAPESFYRCLETKLKLERLSTMETFIDALDHI
ncbi:hypothetical protein ACJMK2_014792 [Sinanodonta woodiana]|uniref:TIR domain-containing protein n=1 Tax=Sinanodonta woodiana TaxID=1069815 RepID=A0ABD3V2E1_SINWO